jgi:beta-fructofuranosidase
LFHPGNYDDIEVPSVFEMEGRFYLLGSIREDRKVHYWYSDDFFGPYRNYSDNVLMPQVNYAARVCEDADPERKLVWSFFFRNGDLLEDHLLPPPKEIVVRDGHLRLHSYQGFDAAVTDKLEPDELMPLDALLSNPDGSCEYEPGGCRMQTLSGFEGFVLRGEHQDYRLSGTLHVENDGKLGLIMHLDDEGDGYYISLDPVKAIAQIRYWSNRPGGTVDGAFEYRQLQEAFHVSKPGPIPFLLISFGSYIELSVHGEVMLSLSDDRRQQGRVGFYVESAQVRVTDLAMETLYTPPVTAYVAQDPGAHPLTSAESD